MIFRIHDVGGQRSERRKWLYLFDCVHAVVFCVSLTNYSQKVEEDSEMNKMHEAIKVNNFLYNPIITKTCVFIFFVFQLFNMIANSKVFLDASIILFLNKTDIFAELCQR